MATLERTETFLPITSIRVDGGTQSRTAINQDKVREYAALLEDGVVFPPIIVYYDGDQYWLACGFHRLNANMLAFGLDGTIAADIRQGTCHDAILYSLSANSKHGLPRSNADKRMGVLRMLRDPEWGQWGDELIARHCGVTVPTVTKCRAELFAESQQGKIPLFPQTEAPKVQALSPRTVADVASYQAAANRNAVYGNEQEDFVEWKIFKGQLVIQTAEDSVCLSASQALTLLEFLQHKKDSLRGIN